MRGDRFETLSDVIVLGGQVRACYRGGWGFTSFNRMEDIATQIENTIAVARLIGDDETLLSPIEPIEASCSLPLVGIDPRQVSIARKKSYVPTMVKFSVMLTPKSPLYQFVMGIVPSKSSSPPPMAPYSTSLG